MGRAPSDSKRLELGSGQRPSPGYLTSDINAFVGIDFVCSPEDIGLPDKSLSEVLALGVIEHLTYSKVRLTFTNVYRMLETGGEFVFDVPDLYAWCKYYVLSQDNVAVPFSPEHVLATLYGWQRWGGDEHKSGWCKRSITHELNQAGFRNLQFGVQHMVDRGHDRNRFKRPEDAHIYVVAIKG